MPGILFPRGVVEGRESLEAYRARRGYAALDKALKQLSSDQVMQEVAESGLRGRGGAGFPTGKSGPSRLKLRRRRITSFLTAEKTSREA